MKRNLRKILASLLILATCTNTIDISAFATENNGLEQVQTEETVSGNDTVSAGDLIVEEEGKEKTQENIYEAEGYLVTFKLVSSWEGGYNANIRIDNTSDVPIENWKIQMDYTGDISNIWNAVMEESEEGIYIIKNSGWNQDIAVGSYVEFGLSGQENFVDFPTAYKMLSVGTTTNEEDYTIEYQVQSDWETGFNGLITITNNTEETIEDWVLEFDFDNNITSIWDGVIQSQDGIHYVIKNASYNQNIAPNASVSIGFNVSSGISENVITNLLLRKYTDEANTEPQREREPFESIGEAYCKETLEEDIVFDEETGIQYVKNQLLISAYMGAEKSIFEEIAAEVGAEIVGYIELTNDYQIEFTTEKTLEEMQIIADYINSFSFVSSVTLNNAGRRETEATESDDALYNDKKTCITKDNIIDTDGDGYGDKKGTDYSSAIDKWDESHPNGDNWGLEALNVLSAWDYKEAFQPVRVGIYDEGFDYDATTDTSHEDLIFDDVANNAIASEDRVHGTHVAGILAAQHNNSRGISGIATDTRLYAYGTEGNEYGSEMEDKIAYAVLIGNHVKVINVSMAFEMDIMFAASHPEIDATYAVKARNNIQSAANACAEYLNKLVAAGYDFVICAAAANTNDKQFIIDTNKKYGVRLATQEELDDTSITKYSGNVLACYASALSAIADENLKKRIIVVGAMRNNFGGNYGMTSFSNIGDRIDFVAPGQDILSAVPKTEDPEGYALKKGTSMASPYVASLVAMMYQVNPAMRATNVKRYISNSSVKTISDGIYTYKIPDAVRCYEYAKSACDHDNNDTSWPSGIVSGYTKGTDGKAVENVKITAVRKSTGEYNLGQYSFVFESDSQGCYMQVLPQGTYDFVVSKDGYLPYLIQDIIVEPDVTTYREDIILNKWITLSYSNSSVLGTVKDALKGTMVQGATVKLRKGWNNKTGVYVTSLFGDVREATTTTDGSFSVDVRMGTYTVEIVKKGYVTGYFNVIAGDKNGIIPLANTTMVLTPVLADDEYRIVLTWGNSPSDLDSHLKYYVNGNEKFHVYYGNKTGSYGETAAKLDLDDTSSYGPETVTITLDVSCLDNGGKFKYMVRNFSNRGDANSKTLSLSNATIRVYAGNNLVNTFYVPKDEKGTVWHVFDITEEGIKAVNEFSNSL